MKEDEMDEACRPHCIQNFDSEAWNNANASKSKRRFEKKNIRIVLKNPDGKVRTGFIATSISTETNKAGTKI